MQEAVKNRTKSLPLKYVCSTIFQFHQLCLSPYNDVFKLHTSFSLFLPLVRKPFDYSTYTSQSIDSLIYAVFVSIWWRDKLC